MNIKQLIEKLQEYPEDMPVAIMDDISWVNKDDPNVILVEKHTWSHGNYPSDRNDFDYVNLG